MTSGIISFVREQAGTFILDALKKGMKHGETDPLAELVRGQQSIVDLNKALHIESLVWDSIQQITYWTEQMQARLKKEMLRRKEAEAAGKPVPLIDEGNFKHVM